MKVTESYSKLQFSIEDIYLSPIYILNCNFLMKMKMETFQNLQNWGL